MVNCLIRSVFVVFIATLVSSCKQSETKTNPIVQREVTSEIVKENLQGNLTVKHELILNEPYKGGNILTAEWENLIPEDELAVLLNPPEYLDQIEENTIEDQLANNLQNTAKPELPLNDYQQALVSTNTIALLDGVIIRIPGFVVPLEINSEQVITSFFVVPYFGACIHLPPPAPNQMIYIDVKQGLKLNSIHDPVWVSGKLSTTLTENDLATSAYSMEIYAIENYGEVVE